MAPHTVTCSHHARLCDVWAGRNPHVSNIVREALDAVVAKRLQVIDLVSVGLNRRNSGTSVATWLPCSLQKEAGISCEGKGICREYVIASGMERGLITVMPQRSICHEQPPGQEKQLFRGRGAP